MGFEDFDTSIIYEIETVQLFAKYFGEAMRKAPLQRFASGLVQTHSRDR